LIKCNKVAKEAALTHRFSTSIDYVERADAHLQLSFTVSFSTSMQTNAYRVLFRAFHRPTHDISALSAS